MYNPESILENETHKILWDFEIQTDYLIPARRIDLAIVSKQERTHWIVDFAVPVDHRVKLKESKQREKYLDLAREQEKKLWNMKVTVKPIVTGVHGFVTKGLVRGRCRSSKLEYYWNQPEYWEESWRLEETCCQLHSRG